MNDAVAVGVLHGAGDDRGVARGAFGRQGTFFDDMRERLAFDQIHREEMLPGLFPDVVNRDDVWMLHRSDGLSLGSEARDKSVAGKFAEEQSFDRDDAIQGNLARPKNNSHPAASD